MWWFTSAIYLILKSSVTKTQWLVTEAQWLELHDFILKTFLPLRGQLFFELDTQLLILHYFQIIKQNEIFG